MKATDLALFFDEMKRQDINFEVDKLLANTFNSFFGVEGDREANVEREGVFLSVYVSRDSMVEDSFIKSMIEHLTPSDVWLYKIPYNEVLYIIKIENESI